MMFLANKRGISPLVATILLIALSVGMGVAVMSWGEDYIEQRAEFVQGVRETPTNCDFVSFSIIQIEGVQQLCQEGQTIMALIDNGPDEDISDFHVRVVAEKGIAVREGILMQLLPRSSAIPIAFSIGDVGAVKQVKLTPKLNDGKQVFCSRQALITENIRRC